MYESPIEMIIGKMQTQMEDCIVKAVQSYNINVDKDELVKALRYDRDQYNKGYSDGRKSMTKCGEWIFEKGDGMTCVDGWYCSNCKHGFHTNVPYFGDYNFCPNCGAMMNGGEAV